MKSLFTAAMWLYGRLVRLLALFGHQQAARWAHGRQDWRNQVAKIPAHRRLIWFHTASAGEFEQARPLIEWHRKFHPNDAILVTFFSPSGYELRKNHPLADVVCYLPEDLPSEVAAWHALVHPALAIFVKYEFWYHHFMALQQRHIPLLLVSAPFRPNQPFFRWPTRRFWGQMLQAVHHFFVQDTASAALLSARGFHNHTVVGDTRTDRVLALAEEPFIDPLLEAFSRGQRVLVAGSTWPADEKLLHAWWLAHPEARLVVAPHEISPARTKALCALFGPDAVVYTQSHPQQVQQARVLILNTMGMLGKVYRYGQAAYIGGGFGKGIHNTLEAAVYGIPVYFGPNHHKFVEAAGIKAAGIGSAVHTVKELREGWQQLESESTQAHIRQQASEWFKKQAGASRQIMAMVNGLLEAK